MRAWYFGPTNNEPSSSYQMVVEVPYSTGASMEQNRLELYTTKEGDHLMREGLLNIIHFDGRDRMSQ